MPDGHTSGARNELRWSGMPAGVRTYVRRPLWLVPATLIIAVLLFLGDQDTERKVAADRLPVEARIVTDGELAQLRYVHPVTAQTVTADFGDGFDFDTLPPPESVVRALADRDDPLIPLLGTDTAVRYVDPGLYLFWVGLGLAPFVVRRLRLLYAARRAARREWEPMVGALRRRRFGGVELHLYDPWTLAGDLSKVTVPLASAAGLPFETVFPVEVNGRPGPLRRITARTDAGVLWAKGVGRPYRRMGLPENSVQPMPLPQIAKPAGRPRWPHGAVSAAPLLLPVFAGLLVFLGFVSAVIVTNRSTFEQDRASRRLALARVVDVADDTLEDYVTLSIEGQSIELTVLDRAPYRVGVDYPVLVARDDVTDVVFRSEGYDAMSPLWFAALPALFLLPIVVTQLVRSRSNEGRSHGSQWYAARVDALERSGAHTKLLIVGPANEPIGGVLARGDFTDLSDAPAAVAGDGSIGAPVAVVVDGELLTIPTVLHPPFEPRRPHALARRGFADANDAVTLRLVAPRLVRKRRPTVTVSTAGVSLYLHGMFGKRQWQIPASNIEVLPDPYEAGIEALTGMTVSNLNTGAVFMSPTTALLFRTPEQVPPLRRIHAVAPIVPGGFKYRQTKKGKASIDGVYLRFDEPRRAHDAMVAAGMRATSAAEFRARWRPDLEPLPETASQSPIQVLIQAWWPVPAIVVAFFAAGLHDGLWAPAPAVIGVMFAVRRARAVMARAKR